MNNIDNPNYDEIAEKQEAFMVWKFWEDYCEYNDIDPRKDIPMAMIPELDAYSFSKSVDWDKFRKNYSFDLVEKLLNNPCEKSLSMFSDFQYCSSIDIDSRIIKRDKWFIFYDQSNWCIYKSKEDYEKVYIDALVYNNSDY